MFFIKSTLDKDCAGYEKVFASIDKKIAQYSTTVLNNNRYGFNQDVNTDNFEALLNYRDILLRKIKCDICLEQYTFELIVSKIRKLTNSLC